MAKIAPETSDTMTMGRTVPLPVVGEASPLVVVVVAFGFEMCIRDSSLSCEGDVPQGDVFVPIVVQPNGRVRAFHHIGAGGKQGIHFEYGFISVAFKRDIRFQRNEMCIRDRGTHGQPRVPSFVNSGSIADTPYWAVV